MKLREAPANIDNNVKFEAAEAKLSDLASNMAVLGKEASAAMASVEAQQQRLTLHRLTAMVFSTLFISLVYRICNMFAFLFSLESRFKQNALFIREFYRCLMISRKR